MEFIDGPTLHDLKQQQIKGFFGWTYLKPLVYPAELAVRLYAGPVGGSSFTLYNDLFVKGEEVTPVAEGEFVIVWFDYRTGKSTKVPQALRALLEGPPS